MFFWHISGSIAIFRFVFRDPKVDVRLLAFGAIAANLIDKPLTLLTPLAPRSVGHTLLLPLLLMAIGLLATRRGRPRRAWMAVVIGMLLHLVLDGMWFDTETLLWPLFGPFPAYHGPAFPDLTSPIAWIMEAAGVAYLVYLVRKAGLSDPSRRGELLRTGLLEL